MNSLVLLCEEAFMACVEHAWNPAILYKAEWHIFQLKDFFSGSKLIIISILFEFEKELLDAT